MIDKLKPVKTFKGVINFTANFFLHGNNFLSGIRGGLIAGKNFRGVESIFKTERVIEF